MEKEVIARINNFLFALEKKKKALTMEEAVCATKAILNLTQTLVALRQLGK